MDESRGQRLQAGPMFIVIAALLFGPGMPLTWRIAVTWPQPGPHDGPEDGPAIAGSQRTIRDAMKQKTPVE
ncbi:hypothetical protein [Rubrivivax sp. A210]|uniref:hypothetical protein n=1 Tax=Rubrivivax sp. A210 TaxID=2772301 RepID=UPI001917EFC1|nr:hypothetical protein [Rubrivivax sp. A210]